LRIADDGVNRICTFSPDGITFAPFTSVGRTDFLTANAVIFFGTTVDTVSGGIINVLHWKQA